VNSAKPYSGNAQHSCSEQGKLLAGNSQWWPEFLRHLPTIVLETAEQFAAEEESAYVSLVFTPPFLLYVFYGSNYFDRRARSALLYRSCYSACSGIRLRGIHSTSHLWNRAPHDSQTKDCQSSLCQRGNLHDSHCGSLLDSSQHLACKHCREIGIYCARLLGGPPCCRQHGICRLSLPHQNRVCDGALGMGVTLHRTFRSNDCGSASYFILKRAGVLDDPDNVSAASALSWPSISLRIRQWCRTRRLVDSALALAATISTLMLGAVLLS